MGGTESGTGRYLRYSVPQAARLLGISERAVRKRIDVGHLRAEREGARWVVLLEAAPVGTEGGTEPASADPPGVAVSPAAYAQLAAIRDEWLAPLVDRVAALERENGRLEAERDALRRRLEEAEREVVSAPGQFDVPARSGAWARLWRRVRGG